MLASTTLPDLTLKKKSQRITYHFCERKIGKDEWQTMYVNTHYNEADLLTKLLPRGDKQKGIVHNILHHIL